MSLSSCGDGRIQGQSGRVTVILVLVTLVLAAFLPGEVLPGVVDDEINRPFIRGDSNGDGHVSMADIMAVTRYFYRKENVPACRDAADVDDSGVIDITDLVGLANFLFIMTGRSELLPGPYPAAGVDTTTDDLDCVSGSRLSHAAARAHGLAGGKGLAAGGGATLPCSASDFLADTGPVSFLEGIGGQLVDFVLFARRCVHAHPGQQLRIPIGIMNRDDIDGFTLSVSTDPEMIRLERFEFDGTSPDEFSPDLTYNYDQWSEQGHLAATVFMDFNEPFFGKVFPAPGHVAHGSNLVLSVAPTAQPGEVLHVQFSPAPGLDDLRPPVRNEFSVQGKSRRPWFSGQGLTIKIVPRDRLFIRGDANGDFRLTITDVIVTLGYLFQAAHVECVEALDSSGDGGVNVSDAVYVAEYLFRGGPAPALPFPHPGIANGTVNNNAPDDGDDGQGCQ